MSMSDCDWIIYGPDGTVTVDIGKWETYRAKQEVDKELEYLRWKVEELEKDLAISVKECERLEDRVDELEAKLGEDA